MTWDQYYVIALALGTIVLLALERAHLSVLGITLIVAVATPGLVGAEEAIAGLANPALVTIAALFIVGEGFLRTGAASMLADAILHRTGNSEGAIVFMVMVLAATLSAFVNNTLVVVTFLPVITTICRDGGFFPSRLLIPLSYASILGGMCTLVGTSTNLLVRGALNDLESQLTAGVALPEFEMFTLTPAGLAMAGAGILYLGLVGRRLLPRHHSLSTQMAGGALKEYVMEIRVSEGSPLAGQRADEISTPGGSDIGPKTMMLVRGEALHGPPFTELTVQPGDILMLSGSIQDLSSLQMGESRAAGADGDSYDPATMTFFELALAPSSAWIGKRVGEVHLKADYGAVVVAVQRSGRHIRERASTMTLQSGDVLLVFGDDRSKSYLRMTSDFHVVEGVHESIYHRTKAPWAFGVIVLVVVLFVSRAVHHSTAALIGALSMTVTGCLTVRQTHQSVRWSIVLFIAGMLALSKAMASTGTTHAIAEGLTSLLPTGADNAWWLLLATFVATVVLTEFLTNNAVAVLMTPLAYEMAVAEGLSVAPYVFAVALGASSSFANPMGYQTNLMVYGPGGYRFRNFVKIGLPLDLLLIAVGVTVIPWLWPLR